MKSEFSLSALVAFALLAFVFTVGFLVLAFRLKTEQVDGAAEYRRQMQAQLPALRFSTGRRFWTIRGSTESSNPCPERKSWT
jgi:hypothetical protein